MIAFRGQKKVGPRPDWSPLGYNSKFLTSIPAPFIWESLPGADIRSLKSITRIQQTRHWNWKAVDIQRDHAFLLTVNYLGISGL